MKDVNIGVIIKKYIMVLALLVVIVFFNWKTAGNLLLPQNVNNLISQNAYVFVLAAGMLLCILTGGNIDLACGSVICFVGGIGGVMMDKGINEWAAVVVMLVGGLLVGALLMGVINMGMLLMGIDSNYRSVVKGLVLLVAIIFDVLSNKKKK